MIGNLFTFYFIFQFWISKIQKTLLERNLETFGTVLPVNIPTASILTGIDHLGLVVHNINDSRRETFLQLLCLVSSDRAGDRDGGHQAVEGRGHRGELGVVTTNALDGEHLDVHLVAGPQFVDEDVLL